MHSCHLLCTGMAANAGQCCIVCGTACTGFDHASAASLLNCTCLQIRLDDPAKYQSIVDAEWNIIYQKLDAIAASGAKIVLSRLAIGDLATQYFADRDIFCAGRVCSLRICHTIRTCKHVPAMSGLPKVVAPCTSYLEPLPAMMKTVPREDSQSCQPVPRQATDVQSSSLLCSR
jgi:TCP-1/cpn60 chaperonin family